MKVVAVNASPRLNGNTSIAIKKVFAVLEKEGIETELLQIGPRPIRGCVACMGCFKAKNGLCVFTDDPVNEFLPKLRQADGIILGSPTYFADLTAGMKAFMERVGYVSRANDGFFRRKVGAAVVAVRRGGAIHAYDSMNHFFGWAQMYTVGSSYWNMMVGREVGDVENDAEGITTMENLGENMAFLLKKLQG